MSETVSISSTDPDTVPNQPLPPTMAMSRISEEQFAAAKARITSICAETLRLRVHSTSPDGFTIDKELEGDVIHSVNVRRVPNEASPGDHGVAVEVVFSCPSSAVKTIDRAKQMGAFEELSRTISDAFNAIVSETEETAAETEQ